MIRLGERFGENRCDDVAEAYWNWNGDDPQLGAEAVFFGYSSFPRADLGVRSCCIGDLNVFFENR
jgi:hypothetical protein